jgi:predicted nucleic acid-binding protein
MVAATALSLGERLVSEDAKAFDHVPGLRRIGYR